MSKCFSKLTLFLFIVVFMSTSLLTAGMKTTMFQGKEVVSNSIVVVDKVMQKSGTPTKANTVLSALERVKSTYSVRIGKQIAQKDAEEWQISGDMEKALNELNAIPGISAFPNYVFHRPEVTQKSLDKSKVSAFPDWRVQKTMGPTGESGQYAVVDNYNQLWVTDYGTPGTCRIFVFNPDGSQAWFSPITSALDDTGAVLSLTGQQMGGVAYYNGVVYAISYVAKKIVRFNSYDGSPLNAIPISFSAGDLDIDQYGRIFVAYKTAAQFAVFDANGVQMKGSPFGVTGWSVNRGLSVTPDGSKILLANETKNLVYEWNGIYPTADSASFEKDTTDFVRGLNKPSACEIDAYSNVWISNSGANEFVVTDMSGTILKRIPNLTAVRGAAFDNTNNYAYAIHFTSAVPMVSQLEPLVDDPYFGYQYALNNDGSWSSIAIPGADLDILRAWKVSTGGKMLVNGKKQNVIVAVFDDGVDFDHEDLKNNAWVNPGEDLNGDGVIQSEEWNGVDDDNNGFVDDFWGWSPVYDENIYLNSGSFHGTHVAGIIGAEGMNGLGISGVNQHVKFISVMIFNSDGETDAITIMYGYYYVSTLLKQGVNIVAMNQSWGGGAEFLDRGEARFVECMTNYALEHNQYKLLWVCSSGNTGTNGDEANYYRYPSGIQAPNIIAVGATDESDNMVNYSTYGKVTTDVGAPGDYIVSTYPGNSYVLMSGTSMASPHVTGIVALAKSVFPNDDAYASIARVLGTAERNVNFKDDWMTEARVNAFYAVSPESLATGLIPSVAKAYVTRSMYDAAGMITLGFVNATGAAVTVNEVTITGDKATDFSLFAPFVSKTIQKGEAFGIPITFSPATPPSKTVITGTLVTIKTTGGDVVIPIVGEEKTYAEISIDPIINPMQLVQWGDTTTTSFNVLSTGDKSLEYSLNQYLIDVGLDKQNPQLASLIKYKPVSAAPARADVNKRTLVAEQFDRIAPVVAGLDRKHISISSNSKGESVLWSDSLNNPAVVEANWYTMAFGSGDGADETFKLTDVDPTEAVNNVFLAGDFVNGYKNGTLAVAVSPMFDFLPIGDQTGMRPTYLQFDYAAQLENNCDFFYVNIIVDGAHYQTIVQTDWELTADSLMRTVYVDISHLWGMRNVEFWFIFNADDSYVGGFGSLFDNVGIFQTDAPYFASKYDGVLEPGQTETITSTLRSDLLYPSEFYLISILESNAIIQDYYNSMNMAPFNIVTGHLTINPKIQDIGAYYRNETAYSNFTATNDGLVDVYFWSDYIIRRTNDGDDDITPTAVKTIKAAKAAVESKEKSVGTKATNSKSLEARRNVIGGMLTQKPTKSVSTKGSLVPVRSGFFRGFRGDFGETIYTENFDSSNVLPEGWQVDDYSYGLGDNWHLENFGSDTLVDNLMFFGNRDIWEYYPNSMTVAYSPVFDFTSMPDDTSRLIFEFNYAAYVEPGYDYFYMYVGYIYEDTTGTYIDWRYVGDTDDVFENDGEMHSIMLNLSRAKGHKMMLAFCAYSDESVNEGYAAFDNLKVYTLIKDIFLRPSNGPIAVGQTQDFRMRLDIDRFKPGNFVARTMLGYEFNYQDWWDYNAAIQRTSFQVLNRAPKAVNDTINVVSGDVINAYHLLDAAIENDYDEDNDEIFIYDVTDPVYGAIKYLSIWNPFKEYNEETFPAYYVAPLNYDGMDMIKYGLTDEYDIDIAKIFIRVMAEPKFVTGVQQQYTFLEDDSLILNTIKMAAGVGGMDKDLYVWAKNKDNKIKITVRKKVNRIKLETMSPDTWGQTTVMFYVGRNGEAIDSLKTTFVIVPVNDPPVAKFSANANNNTVTFVDESNDAADPEGAIVSWNWEFGDGTTSTDKNPVHVYTAINTYNVKLTVTDNANASTTCAQNVIVSSIVAVDKIAELPTKFELSQNFPNPFNPITNIAYALPERSMVKIAIYDILGKEIVTLVNKTEDAGYRTIQWNGTDKFGSPVSTGIYVYRIQAGKFIQTKKMVFMK